uniref:MYND-type domain-containing protein n=1 Tax=Caenorhabditis japonica TaxID=281687 RepID=A0A8R1IEJ8_CAEJA
MNIATIDDSGGTVNVNDGSAKSTTTSALFTTLMLSQQPSSSKTVLQCTFCGNSCSPVQLQACLFCGTVAYCSKEHQQLDWSSHKMICKSLQTRGLVPSNLMPPTAVATPQAINAPPPPPVFTDTALTTSLLLSLQKNALINQALHSQPPTFSMVPLKTDPEPVPQRITASANFFSQNSAFRPYRSAHVFNSLSSESVSSLVSPPTSHEASLNHMSSASMFPTSNASQTDISRLATTSTQVISLKSEKPVFSVATPPGPSTASLGAALIKKEPVEKIIQTDDPDIQIIETDSNVSASKPQISRARKRPTPSSSADPKINYKDHNKNVVYSTTLQEHQKHLQNRGLALNIHQAMVLRLRYIAEHVIRSLNEFGWAVVDNFLGSDHYKYTAK